MKKSIVLVFVFLACVAVGLTGCADRKDLETPAPVPVIQNNPSDPGSLPGGGCTNPTGPASTKYCAADTTGKYPGDNHVITSGMNADGSAWAEGGGCILRPIREVWAVFNSYTVMKFDGADSYTVDHPTIQLNPTITNFYQLTYSHTAYGFFTVHWTIQWFNGVSEGTFEAPNVVNIVYQRTQGTSHISVWHGSITLAKLNDSTTSFFINNNFKATQSENDNIGSARDVVDEMLGKGRTSAPDWNNLNNHE